MESPRIHVGQTGQRGRMNTLRTSSIIRSGIGISVIRFSSLRLICFNLGASFFSYAVSFIGLGHNTFLSTAIYMSRFGPAHAMIHVPVPASQLLLEKNLERFGELPGDVWKGDVLRFAGFDELPEIELCGFRLAVGGVNLLGAVPKTFAFHLFGLQEVFRHGIGIWYSGLEQFDRNHSLVPQQVPICLFLSVTEGGKAGVFFDRWKNPFPWKKKMDSR